MKAPLPLHGATDRAHHCTPRLLQHLEKRLQQRLKGEVHFEKAALAHYSKDASNITQLPLGVVRPRTVEDILETLQLCSVLGVPVTPRGGGTSLAGQPCNKAIILDTSRWLNAILEIDPEQKTARVQPGVILDDLNREARKHHLIFGPDPVSRGACTLGGMIGNNAWGPHSLMTQYYGNGPSTSDQIISLDVATYGGERLQAKAAEHDLDALISQGGVEADIYARLDALRIHYNDTIRSHCSTHTRRVGGFLLEELLPERGFHLGRALCGTEGSCVSLLEASLHLTDDFAARSVVILGFHSQDEAIDQIPEILTTSPTALESLSRPALEKLLRRGMRPTALSYLPVAREWLLVEYGAGTPAEARALGEQLIRAFHNRGSTPSSRLIEGRGPIASLWDLYETSVKIIAHVPSPADAWVGWETSAVPVQNLRLYLRDLRSLLDSYQYEATLYGNFGQGIVQSWIDYGTPTEAGIEAYQRYGRDAALLALHHKGSASAARADCSSLLFGESLLSAFAAFKLIWDPQRGMNPGKPSFASEHPFAP